MHITERQQAWFNFSQGVELPDPGKYYGRGTYGAAVNGHLPLTNSVNVDDSKLEGVKVDSYELGWRFTGDNLRTPNLNLLLDLLIRAWWRIKT
ncbi:Aerobactin siderophore ferric receptor protein IutA [Salmonella enterica subsp. arizonae]|uniref:Aerobactin siderophore ferric receptor protein IutA n=1 Tax=Salmonella enterica subsp. arizonae TaxID=59203 RepID=A0A2X4TWL8_SALER|nr:Aerobactin siderophore ferric receptor protein IutA [Salmonella enterica subsp. arizonae]